MSRKLLLTLLALLAAPVSPAAAQEAAKGIHFELNKAETVNGTCRVTLVTRNDMASALKAFSVDLVVFDDAEGVAGYAAIDIGALPAGKTRVRQYDVAKGDCGGFSRFLVNDVRACEGASGEVQDCLGALRLSSRTKIDLVL
ncbi:hypothetical protein [Breoghania sp. L-A4]|uniref:hypothetical protein n=1 Tax=Breoghania sp. L-A4 TaxID=2304600 RepID=UPI000E35DCB6|nr:hypothetical protein [Breoghania sp. L-A4]AXS41662.1 hypothetical protein D1F64_18735 [Breoghania sp. L-A4]